MDIAAVMSYITPPQPTLDYRNMIEHMLTAVIQVSPSLDIEYINPACEALLEMSCARAYGMSLLTVLAEAQENFDTYNAILNTLHTGQPYIRREATLNVGLKDKAVDYSVTLMTAVDTQHQDLIQNSSGQTTSGQSMSDHPATEPPPTKYLLIEIQPIDRLQRINRDEHLNQQYQIARQLVRGVAHEIKNPLAGIRGATQLLARSIPDGSINEYTDIILDEVDRLCILADTMLGSRQIPALTKVNVHEPLERVRSLILSQTNKTVNIVRDYDLSLPEVNADRDQLIQVILNICVNAAQAFAEHPDFFAQPAMQQPQIILRTRIWRMFNMHGILHRSVVRIDIEDNGPGIPAEILESVFYPMVTGRASGTGLGLSLAQNMMHQHGGMIECHSEVGRTIFSLSLPWQ